MSNIQHAIHHLQQAKDYLCEITRTDGTDRIAVLEREVSILITDLRGMKNLTVIQEDTASVL